MFNFGDLALSSPYTIHFLFCASILGRKYTIKMIAIFYSCVQACLDFGGHANVIIFRQIQNDCQLIFLFYDSVSNKSWASSAATKHGFYGM